MSAESEFHVPEGFGDYMRQKSKKLQQQYSEAIAQKSTLFRGVVVYVDGYTEPSSSELKQMLVANGGVYTLYLNSRVTHVVCEHLPHAKLAQLAVCDLIVRPAWIVESLQQGKLLPVDRFVVASARRDATQRTLPFAETRTAETPKLASVDTNHTSSTTMARAEVDTHLELNGRPSAADNPRLFVQHFYEQSRLHHLSTWKAQLQQDLQDFVAKRAGVTLAHATSSTATTRAGALQTYLYVDMDSFFAAVSLAKRPHLAGLPVVVCHASPTSVGHADIASASYAARKFGIRNGMWMHEAKKLCPTLVSVPYDFDEYETASRALYECILRHSAKIEVRSCDEAVCALACDENDAMHIARAMRNDIFVATNCSASVGIGSTILAAKLACRFAKPQSDGSEGRGVYTIPPGELASVLAAMPIRSLPGVGYRTAKRLLELHTGVPAAPSKAPPVHRKPDAEVDDENDDASSSESEPEQAAPKMTVGDLVAMPLAKLQAALGAQIGQQLYNTARGIDKRELRCHVERKSLGAEINFGIRFTTMDHVANFVRELAREVERRARAADYRGSMLTLKLKQREPDAGEALKFLGHGIAFNLSKSHRLAEPSCDMDVIADASISLYRSLGCPPDQLRGIGIHLSQLERGAAVASRQPSIRAALAAATTTTPAVVAPVATLPPQSQIDPEVWNSLPASLRRELETAYVDKVEPPPPPSPQPAAETKRKSAAAASTSKRRRAVVVEQDENATNATDDAMGVVGERVYDMLDNLLRRQITADVKAGAERRRADKGKRSGWYADSYLRDIDFSVLECLSPAIVRETLREQRRLAAVDGKQQQQQQQKRSIAAVSTRAHSDDSDVPDDGGVAVRQHVADAPPRLFGAGVDARLAVRQWLETHEADGDTFAFLQSQLLLLIESKQLDLAHIALYELRRRAIVSEQVPWQRCFDAVLTQAQNEMHSRYGGLFAFAPLQQN